MRDNRELVAIQNKIMTTRRIIERGPAEDEDEIVHSMIVKDLKDQIPALERRFNWLAAHRESTRVADSR